MKGRVKRMLALGVLLGCLGQGGILTSWAYAFTTGGIEISMNQDASEVLTELGREIGRAHV